MCYTRLHNECESTQEQQAFDWESDQCEYTLNDELNHLVYGYVEELEDGTPLKIDSRDNESGDYLRRDE